MCNQSDALAILAEAYAQCAALIPITDAYLYGSYARGDYSADSDVDIMLVTSLPANDVWKYRRKVTHVAGELSLQHDVIVSIVLRSEEQFQPQALPYYQNVVNDGVRYAAYDGS